MALQDSNNVDCFGGSVATSSNGTDAMSEATTTAWKYLNVATAVGVGSQVGALASTFTDVANNGISVTVASGFNGGTADPTLGGWIIHPLFLDGVQLAQTGASARPAYIQLEIERVTDPTVANSNVHIGIGLCPNLTTLNGSVNYYSGGYTWFGAAGGVPSSYYSYRFGGAHAGAVGAGTTGVRGGPHVQIIGNGVVSRADMTYYTAAGAWSGGGQVVVTYYGSFTVTTPFCIYITATSVGAVPANTAVTFRARYRGVTFTEPM